MKNKKSLLVICASVILIAVGVFLSWPKEEKKSEGKKEEIKKVTVEEAKEFYKYIPELYYEGFTIYQDKAVTIDDVPKELLLNELYTNVDKFDADGSTINVKNEAECTSKNGTYVSNLCYIFGQFENEEFYIPISNMKIKYEKFYGPINELPKVNSINDLDKCVCELNNENYYCNCRTYIDLDEGSFKNATRFNKFEQAEDELYIYVDYLYAYYASTDESGSMYVKVYDKKDGKELGFAHTFFEDVLFDSYEKGASLYKHTYKKDANGNYYWTKVEPVTK